jgi:endonuclease/exonuclease/phosphatase family metal-dependent hydrolase
MKHFSIATWNFEALDDREVSWSSRLKVLRDMFQRTNADILLLQEVNTLSALETLRCGTFCEDFAIANTKTKAGNPYDQRNLVILSRWNISKVRQYLNTIAPAPVWKKITRKPPETEAKEVGWERPILHVEIDLNGRRMHVVNIHLKSMLPSNIEGQQDSQHSYQWLSHVGWAEGYFLSDLKRVGQALETRMLVDKIFAQEGDNAIVVVGGDYNADLGSVPFKTIVGSVDDTSNPDLRPGVLIPCEMNVPSTKRFSLLHRGIGNMIDHIAVSQAFYPYWEETVIFNELLPDKSIAFATTKFPESDHAPIVAHFCAPDSWIP